MQVRRSPAERIVDWLDKNQALEILIIFGGTVLLIFALTIYQKMTLEELELIKKCGWFVRGCS